MYSFKTSKILEGLSCGMLNQGCSTFQILLKKENRIRMAPVMIISNEKDSPMLGVGEEGSCTGSSTCGVFLGVNWGDKGLLEGQGVEEGL